MLFHAKIAGFSGGYVGVDIFYVISGYLITSLVAKDILRGNFSFVAFYERRIRRIFPALFSVIFFCILVAAALFVPRDFAAFGKSVLAVTLFASNIFFKGHGGSNGYFDGSSESQPLLHTWSLAVEEQFYFLFPTALFLLFRWGKSRVAERLFFAAVASFLISIWMTRYWPLTAFYTLVPRAWELLIGSLLAVNAVPALTPRAVREFAGVLGLGLIACAVYLFSKDTAFPGASATVPCLGAWLVIYAGQSGPSYVKTALSFPPLVFVGVISYSLYLWHWPIIVFSRCFSAGDLSGLQTAVVLATSLGVAFISFELIEKPFRGGDSQIGARQVFYLAVVASALSITLGLAILARRGIPERYDSYTRQLILRNASREDDFQEVCGNWKKPVHSLTDINFCEIGPGQSKKILFWGDSHVQQLYPLISKIHDSGDLREGVLLAIANGCPPAEHLNSIGKGFHCDAFASFAMQRAEEDDVDAVFMGFNTWWSVHEDVCQSVNGKCVARLSPAETSDRFLAELSEHICKLKGLGKRVIISLPFPMFDKSIPALQIRNAVLGKFGLEGVARDITLPSLREKVAELASRTGAEVFDPRESLCPNGGCITELDGVSIYKDDNHIAASQIGILEDSLRRVLR